MNPKELRVLRFAHRAQNLADKLRVPVALAACGLVYALLMEAIDGLISALSERNDADTIKMLRGELRGLRRREDDRTREEEINE